MNDRSNIWKLYALRFFQSLIPAYVIERLFWEERGMTIQMVVWTEIIYAVTIFVLEIPTGIMADKWGRKKMIVLDAAMGCCEFLILIFATEFWHFAVVVFLAGVGRAASSGSEYALLYDSLLLHGKEQTFEKVLGRLNAIDFTSIIIAALCGSLLAGRFGFEFNYWISLAAMLISLVISLLLVEPAIKSDTEEEPIEIKRYVTASLRFFRTNPGVCLVVLSGIVTGAAINYIDEFWQLYLNRLDIPVVYFGLFSAAMFVLRLPGNMLAYMMKSRFSYRTILSAVTAVFAAGFLYVSVIDGYSGVAAMMLICLFSGIMEPLASGYLHHRIDSAMRATMDSFQSFGLNTIQIGAGLGFGYFSARYDIFGGYGFIAVVCGAFFITFLLVSKKRL